jgi:alpha-tubulin suppressor-like RCC1 family protein/pimeloyl-ACP methyl ester carboxylesterase
VRRRAVAAAVVSSLMLALSLVAPEASTAATRCPAQSSATTVLSGLNASMHPVILVHGWTGKPLTDTQRLLQAKLGDGWAMFQFDYHAFSNQWADVPQIAACLATYIADLSAAHTAAGGDGKVYLVGHSMGGLAARFAASPRWGGRPVAGLIGGVVTLDTPHGGSPWGNTPDALIFEALKGFPNPFAAGAVDASRCLALHQGATGMPPGCDVPPYLAKSIPITQIAGVLTVDRTLFGYHLYDISMGGDTVVPLDSEAGYIGSGVQGKNATVGSHIHFESVPCTITSDRVFGFAATLGAGLFNPRLGLALARLDSDNAAMDALGTGKPDIALLQFLALAYAVGDCAHSNITHNDEAITAVEAALKADARLVGAGCATTCTEWSWGNNTNGGLGDGTTSSSAVPVKVSGLTGVTAISGSYALRSDGTVWAWGSNTQGQLGNGTTGNNSTEPVKVSGLTGVTAIAGALDGGSGYALRSDGTVWAWGPNQNGELGDGTTTQSAVPVKVSGLTGVTAIAGSGGTGYALRSDGTVWEWGSIFDTPDDPTISHFSLVPVKVSGLTGVTAIAGSYALRSDGTVWAWGGNRDWADNLYGSLGDGTTSNGSTVPVRVSGLIGVTASAAGLGSGYALRSDGTVWAWGPNFFGELGNGTTTQSTVPVKVSGLTGVTAIAGGHVGAYALRSDGTVWAWGDNHYGALGNGTTTQSTVPVKVSGLTGVAAIAGGDGTGYALVGP